MWDGATVICWVSKTKTLCSFFSFQTPADTSNIHRKAQTGARIDGIKHTHTPTHTADDSYKYHRTRIRSDSYTICIIIVPSIPLSLDQLLPGPTSASERGQGTTALLGVLAIEFSYEDQCSFMTSIDARTRRCC